MIKNIVLDMGNVLLDYNPEISLGMYCSSEEEKDVLKSVSPKSAPYLKLLKNTKSAKKEKDQSSEWAEDKNIMKSPVFIIGFVLALMVILILFW